MSLSIGIVGLPNVGKSTLFNALTRSDVAASNYPFTTIESNVGVVAVPEPRLSVVAKMFRSARMVPPTVKFVDIAGLVQGAWQGHGLGNQFLANIREVDAVCQVVRVFSDPDVAHVDGEIDPARDIDTINTELILADLQTLEKALPRLEKEAKLTKEAERLSRVEAATAARRLLDSGLPLHAAAASAGIELRRLEDLHLITAKPVLYVFNVDTNQLTDVRLRTSLAELVTPAKAVSLDAATEAELAELAEDEALELLRSVGQQESGLAQLARAGFATLGLRTFLTARAKEARAWTIRGGATAFQAAGLIHSDFQRGFIKAEVVSYQDLTAAGSLPAAKAAGKVRMEGKDYVVEDGDVVEFHFNV